MTDTLRDHLQASLGAAYTLERELGGGGMARVFVATEPALARQVVVKLLSPEIAEGLSAAAPRVGIELAAGDTAGAIATERRLAGGAASRNLPELLFFAAEIAVVAGERDAALAWLGELLATPSIYTPAYLRVDPTWAPLRGDPRFEALLAARQPSQRASSAATAPPPLLLPPGDGTTSIYASSPSYAGLPSGARVAGELQMPSLAQSGLKVDLPGGAIRIEGDQRILLVDFDVAQSFGRVAGGSGRWVMHPVVHATDFVASGTLTATLRPAQGVALPLITGHQVTLGEFITTPARPPRSPRGVRRDRDQ